MSYQEAKERYLSLGVDTDKAIEILKKHSCITSLLARRRCYRL